MSAAISSITAQVTTQVTLGVLSQQNLDEIFKQITRPETFKNAAVSAITAGALFEVGRLQEAANTSALLCKIQNAGVQAGVGLGVDLLSGDDLDKALKGAGIQFASQGGSSIVAGEIGKHLANKTDLTARCLHKLAHGASAAAFAGAGAAAFGQDIGTAAAGGALGAMTAEIVAEALAKPLQQDVVDEVKKQQDALGRPITAAETKTIFDAKLQDITQIAKLTGAISGLVTGDILGVNAAGTSSNNAINNNFFAAAAPLIWEAVVAALAETATTGVSVGIVGVGGYALHKAMEPAEGAGDSVEAENPKPQFERNQKHRATQQGRANPEPNHPQETLDKSVKVSENSSRRVGADKSTGEFDVFDEHTPGKFHGHSRNWGELTEAMKSVLIKAKITNYKGKIL